MEFKLEYFSSVQIEIYIHDVSEMRLPRSARNEKMYSHCHYEESREFGTTW
jgi:hypothetical protein